MLIHDIGCPFVNNIFKTSKDPMKWWNSLSDSMPISFNWFESDDHTVKRTKSHLAQAVEYVCGLSILSRARYSYNWAIILWNEMRKSVSMGFSAILYAFINGTDELQTHYFWSIVAVILLCHFPFWVLWLACTAKDVRSVAI